MERSNPPIAARLSLVLCCALGFSCSTNQERGTGHSTELPQPRDLDHAWALLDQSIPAEWKARLRARPDASLHHMDLGMFIRSSWQLMSQDSFTQDWPESLRWHVSADAYSGVILKSYIVHLLDPSLSGPAFLEAERLRRLAAPMYDPIQGEWVDP